jgi:hypothetical protein
MQCGNELSQKKEMLSRRTDISLKKEDRKDAQAQYPGLLVTIGTTVPQHVRKGVASAAARF